ncbi:MAG: M14 family zinc carboxypeptidase [Planctomycetota bacterium]
MFRVSARRICLFLLHAAILFGFEWSVAETTCHADSLLSVLPDDDRLDTVKNPDEFFGFAIGSRHLRHDQVVAYMRYLAEASDHARVKEYGTTHGHRPALSLIISSPENLENLETVRRRHRQLASGRLTEPRPDDHLVMYLGYGVHGDEASAMNAAPLVAYHLASSKSPVVAEWLSRSVYLVDPALNPDGNDRFANWANENRGRLASRDPNDLEHRQAWPGGRTNYYWFDLNRDWLPLTHPESRGRLRLYHRWKPNVVLDFHEMGSDSSYFFQPGIPERTNPLTPERNVTLTQQFAREHARRLDAAGELFFTEERYDDFYIGKGSTYPDIHGCVGILFEQGSSRGLAIKTDRTDRTFADTIANQVRTSLSSLHSAHRLRDDLLEYQCGFYHDALQPLADSTNAYVLTGEPSRVAAAHDLLRRHDVRCVVPAGPVQIDGAQHLPGHALVIPMPQPESTMVRSLMQTRQQFQENIFYDVSTWHLPSAFDLQTHTITHDVPSAWTEEPAAETTAEPPTTTEPSDEHLGFAIPPSSLSQPRLIAVLQQTGVDLRVATKPFTVATSGQPKPFAAGTVLVLKQPNITRWERTLQRLKNLPDDLKSLLHPLASSQTTRGPDLGSSEMLELKLSRPALFVGEGTDRYVAGALWHHLDVRVRQPTTLINTIDLARVELNRYSCLIVPSGSYGGWGDKQAARLKAYLDDGGTLIAIGSAAAWLETHELIELADGKDKEEEPKSEAPVPFDQARDQAALESIAGAFFAARVDTTHPLAFGFDDERVPIFRNRTLRFNPPENPYQTAAVYGDVIAGYVSEANRKKLKGSAAVFAIPRGEGRVIVLADNPVFRGYVRSTEPFLTNAIYFGPSLKIPSAPER